MVPDALHDTLEDRLQELGFWCVAVAFGWFLCYGLTFIITLYDDKTRTEIENATLVQRLVAAEKLMTTPYFLGVSALAIMATYELGSTVELRWLGVSQSSRRLMMAYVSKMIVDTPIQRISLSPDPRKRMQMTAHHVFSGFAIGIGLCTQRLHFWACMDVCSEVTTLFLNNVFAIKTFCPQASAIGELGIVVNGVLLWLGFIFFRLVLFAAWLWLFIRDVQMHPEKTSHMATTTELLFFPFVTIGLLVLSSIWFVPITKGVLKAVSGKKAKE